MPSAVSAMQSAGEPLTASAGEPSGIRVSAIEMSWNRVFLWPLALWLVAGAMTRTSPSARMALARATMPGARTPSSLVTRM